MKQGDVVKGSWFYGKGNTLEGTITSIDNGIATIEWDDGQVARFYRKDVAQHWQS